MAKTAKTETAAETLNVAGYAITFGDVPAARPAPGKKTDSPIKEAIKGLPAPREIDGEMRFPSVFEPVTAPDTITDPVEREKATKEAQRKMTNSLSGITRRLKKDDATVDFAVRSVVEDGVYGVRVYRTNPAAA